MGKEKSGFLTPKAIANRIKAKGLQKLRWYCQMCQKQCRDEVVLYMRFQSVRNHKGAYSDTAPNNGFKCHLTSESHQRQLLLFAENPDQYIDTFSKEFYETFVELLSRRFGTKRVMANLVYQEYISDREHTHMNSTQWETLTDFVKWLGKEGHCTVDQTEKGWFVQYIDRDPKTIERQEALQKKEKMEMDDEEKTAKFIQQQIERANATTKGKPATEYTDLQRDSEEEKVTFNLGLGTKKKDGGKLTSGSGNALADIGKKKSGAAESDRESTSSEGSSSSRSSSGGIFKVPSGAVKRKSALDEIMEFEEKKKEKINRKDFWLHKDIVVKVITKKLGDKYYKKKGFVKDVVDQYLGVVKMFDSGDKLRVDQAHLETVIPATGKSVLVVNGAYRGSEAILEDIDQNKFCCTISIAHGPLKGRLLEGVQYEDISKLHKP